MRKAFVYRLYPNADQVRELGTMLETHRRLYNEALAQRKTIYDTTQKTLKYTEQSSWYKAQRAVNPFYARLNFSSAQATLRRLDQTYANFFRRVKAKEKPGFPRFKAKNRFSSFTYPAYGDGIRLNGNRLRIQHVGVVKVKLHRPIEGKVKTVTLKCELGKWYVILSCDLGELTIPKSTNQAIGIDVGLTAFLSTSDGEKVENPRLLKAELANLRLAQRKIARRKKGGANRRKAVQALARLYTRIRNKRKDFHHKTARQLVNRFGFIAVEGLNISGMLRSHRFVPANRGLAQAISDAAWGGFLLILKSKAESAGVEVIEVDCRGTSQECSGCGLVFPKGLKVRQHDCPHCGLSICRDVNAAKNILARAAASQRKLARTEPAGLKSDSGLAGPRSLRL